MSLRDKTAIVTGSSRGIGRAIAVKLAENGANVAVTYVNNVEQADKTLNMLRDIGAKSIKIKCDISNVLEIQEMVDEVMHTFGAIDILVNNAGILQQKPFETITEDEWDLIFDVNMKGTAICCQKVIPHMQKQKQGRIINIASIGGQWGGNLAVHYSATKAGIISLTRSLAKIYSKDGILTNCISPGLVLTDMAEKELNTEAGKEKARQIPIGRIASKEEIANVALFLSGNASSYVTGQVINVNGGMLFNT